MQSFEIRLTNLSWQATEEDIKTFVSSFATVNEVKLVLDFKKRSRGLAYVKLADEKSLEEALKEVERTHMERIVKIIRAKPLAEKQEQRNFQSTNAEERPARKTSGSRAPRGRGGRGDGKNSGEPQKRVYRPRHNDDNSIYVGNLSFRTTEIKLGRHFEQYGDIKEVRIVEDEQERSRGFGYVEFEDKDVVEQALAGDGTDLDGRKIRVAKVQKKERKPREEKRE